jgi:hypothetical protein
MFTTQIFQAFTYVELFIAILLLHSLETSSASRIGQRVGINHAYRGVFPKHSLWKNPWGWILLDVITQARVSMRLIFEA